MACRGILGFVLYPPYRESIYIYIYIIYIYIYIYIHIYMAIRENRFWGFLPHGRCSWFVYTNTNGLDRVPTRCIYMHHVYNRHYYLRTERAADTNELRICCATRWHDITRTACVFRELQTHPKLYVFLLVFIGFHINVLISYGFLM